MTLKLFLNICSRFTFQIMKESHRSHGITVHFSFFLNAPHDVSITAAHIIRCGFGVTQKSATTGQNKSIVTIFTHYSTCIENTNDY